MTACNREGKSHRGYQLEGCDREERKRKSRKSMFGPQKPYFNPPTHVPDKVGELSHICCRSRKDGVNLHGRSDVEHTTTCDICELEMGVLKVRGRR